MQIAVKPIQHSIIFSVLLVVRNEEKYIARLVEALLDQDFPKGNYELIIVDGMSTDNTSNIVETYTKEDPSFIRLIQNEGKTLPPGWNLGIRAAKGEYVLRIDGHTKVERDFLTNYWEIIKEKPNAACVGGVIVSKGHGFQGEINEYVYSHPFGVGNSKFRTLTNDWEGYVDTVPYGAYKRELFDQLGLFNEDLKRNEDLEFHKRVRDAGGQFYLSTKIKSTYFVRDSLKGLIKKSLGDGMWTMVANKETPGTLKARHIVPLYVFLISLLLLVGALFHSLFSWLLLGAAGTYLLINGFVSFQLAKQKGIVYFFPCMLTFFCMHFFRGLGCFLFFFKKRKLLN